VNYLLTNYCPKCPWKEAGPFPGMSARVDCPKCKATLTSRLEPAQMWLFTNSS
jgi:hypothetical protein